jgi:hypothetical protein
MHFEREFIAAHRGAFSELVDRTHRIAFGIFVLTFAGYALALWIWFAGNSWAALVIATLGYLFFRQFRTLSFALARMPLRGRAEDLPVLRQVEQALEQGRAAAVVAELEAQLAALEAEEEPS